MLKLPKKFYVIVNNEEEYNQAEKTLQALGYSWHHQPEVKNIRFPSYIRTDNAYRTNDLLLTYLPIEYLHILKEDHPAFEDMTTPLFNLEGKKERAKPKFKPGDIVFNTGNGLKYRISEIIDGEIYKYQILDYASAYSQRKVHTLDDRGELLPNYYKNNKRVKVISDSSPSQQRKEMIGHHYTIESTFHNGVCINGGWFFEYKDIEPVLDKKSIPTEPPKYALG